MSDELLMRAQEIMATLSPQGREEFYRRVGATPEQIAATTKFHQEFKTFDSSVSAEERARLDETLMGLPKHERDKAMALDLKLMQAAWRYAYNEAIDAMPYFDDDKPMALVMMHKMPDRVFGGGGIERY